MQHLSQTQKTQQSQKLLPQQLLVSQLLELTSVELYQRIVKESEENPALELTTPEVETTPEIEDSPIDSQDEFSLSDYLDESDDTFYQYTNKQIHDSQSKEIFYGISRENFYDYLETQLNLLPLADAQKKIGSFLIGSMDPNGYIRRPLDMLLTDFESTTGEKLTLDELKEVLSIIQTLEPKGIGATSLQECLLIQLKSPVRVQDSSTKLAIHILTTHFDNFLNKRYNRLEKLLNISSNQLKQALNIILRLNPKPGFGVDDLHQGNPSTIFPDLTLDFVDNQFVCQLTNSDFPSVSISAEFSELHQTTSSPQQQKETALFVKQSLDKATTFISALSKRNFRLLEITKSIIQKQFKFFETGNYANLQPMILKDLQHDLPYDISVLSRAISNKYIQTDFGLISLKSLFSESMLTNTGETISNITIKESIKRHIDSENPMQPLTDEHLSELLNNEGFSIARRTVAKYREQLGYHQARLRKKLI